MNAFEFNKIAGAVLSALLFIFGTKTLIDIAGSSHGHSHEHKAGYTLPAPTGGSGHGGGAAAPAAFNPAAVVALLPQASADGGKDVFKACLQCHRTGKGEPSPDRIDALVWGMHELFLQPQVRRDLRNLPDFA